jgi:hypothetical protein
MNFERVILIVLSDFQNFDSADSEHFVHHQKTNIASSCCYADVKILFRTPKRNKGKKE